LAVYETSWNLPKLGDRAGLFPQGFFSPPQKTVTETGKRASFSPPSTFLLHFSRIHWRKFIAFSLSGRSRQAGASPFLIFFSRPDNRRWESGSFLPCRHIVEGGGIRQSDSLPPQEIKQPAPLFSLCPSPCGSFSSWSTRGRPKVITPPFLLGGSPPPPYSRERLLQFPFVAGRGNAKFENRLPFPLFFGILPSKIRAGQECGLFLLNGGHLSVKRTFFPLPLVCLGAPLFPHLFTAV